MGVPHVIAFVLAGLFADALDRIVAVVDDRPIFLSELRRRARPHFYRIDFMGGDAKSREAAKAEVMRPLLDRLIDERLEAVELEKAHIAVDTSDVEAGIQGVLAQAKMTREELMAEVKKQQMTEAEYHDEIRRQIIEGKLVNLRVRPRVKVTDADVRNVYATWVKEQQGADAPVDLRMVVLRIPPDANADVKKSKEALAAQIAADAKAGKDFCTLVTTHSDDIATNKSCGSRGPMARSLLLADIAKATQALKPGDVAAPILFTDPAGSQAYLVIQRAPGALPAVPSFDAVKDKMKERAYTEQTERLRKEWLEELRKGAYIEVKP